MGENQPCCLLVCSSVNEGVCAQSFSHTFTMTSSAFHVSIATPQGLPIDFCNIIDDKLRRWVSDFNSKPFSKPMKLETVDPANYSALLFPSCPGALHDLAKCDTVMHVLRNFIKEKKPICAIGYGALALTMAKPSENNEWSFKGYSLTGPSVEEMIQRKDFASLPIIFEDFAKDNLASFSASCPDANHVIIDRNLITAQNSQSTLVAVQNFILACNSRL